MRALSEAQTLSLLQALLLRAVPWMLQQQRPTGELASYRRAEAESALWVPWGCPLLSALAHEALDCLDPNAEHFQERLFDLVPARERSGFRVRVSTLRWRLRMHVAIHAGSDGRWRRFGRQGDSPPCFATTGMALLTYLGQTLRPQRDFIAVMESFGPDEKGALVGEVFASRLRSLAGRAAPVMPEGFIVAMEQATAPHDEARLLGIWAMAQACRDGALHCDAEERAAMLGLGLMLREAESGLPTRHQRAFGLTILSVGNDDNDGNDGGEGVQAAMDRLVADLLLDSDPPWRWRHEAVVFGVSSAGVTMALMLRSLAQQVLAPQAAGQHGGSVAG